VVPSLPLTPDTLRSVLCFSVLVIPSVLCFSVSALPSALYFYAQPSQYPILFPEPLFAFPHFGGSLTPRFPLSTTPLGSAWPRPLGLSCPASGPIQSPLRTGARRLTDTPVGVPGTSSVEEGATVLGWEAPAPDTRPRSRESSPWKQSVSVSVGLDTPGECVAEARSLVRDGRGAARGYPCFWRCQRGREELCFAPSLVARRWPGGCGADSDANTSGLRSQLVAGRKPKG